MSRFREGEGWEAAESDNATMSNWKSFSESFHRKTEVLCQLESSLSQPRNDGNPSNELQSEMNHHR